MFKDVNMAEKLKINSVEFTELVFFLQYWEYTKDNNPQMELKKK